MEKYVCVVIKNATRSFDKLYTYKVCGGLCDEIFLGVRVEVPFGNGNKITQAFVFEILDEIKLNINNIKEVKSVIDKKPLINKEGLVLVEFIKKNYICTYYDALRVMLPVFSKGSKEKTLKAVRLKNSEIEVLQDIQANKFNRIQQIRVLEILLDLDFVGVSDLCVFAGVSRGVLHTLEKKGYIEFFNMEVVRDPFSNIKVERDTKLIPTKEQKEVLKECFKSVSQREFEEILIHGVTGSGKTEIYLQLIEKVLEQGRQAIVLVPEISLTPQMVSRFKARFGDFVAVLHSRLSPGERYDQWRSINDGGIKVAVGARSAVFAPFENLGIIVVDEEHESSYKSEVNPKYLAKEVASFRCKSNNALLVLGSATPAIETYYRAKMGEIKLFSLKARPKSDSLPQVEVVDMRRELEQGNRGIFSRALENQIKENIKREEQTMLFMNRRGFSSFVLCRSCGYVVYCNHCNISMTYHLKTSRLICHYCGFTKPVIDKCPKCSSKSIRDFGVGTQRVEREVLERFNTSVIRMDMDTTTRKNAHEKILTKFREENIKVMIGTQMIAKGHDFPNVTLVGVLAADAILNASDFRSAERTFGLITQVSGRAGRDEKPGRVIVQSYNIDHYSIQHATKHDYEAFYNDEVSIRKKLAYPPFNHIGVLLVVGEDDGKVKEKIDNVYDSCLKFGAKINQELERETMIFISKPLRAPISKIKDNYRWRIVLKASDKEALIHLLTKVGDEFYKKKETEELSMDINPYMMM